MEKIFGNYWVVNKTTTTLAGELKVIGTLKFTTLEKATKYYEEHKDKDTWYEQIQPPKEVIIKIDFIE